MFTWPSKPRIPSKTRTKSHTLQWAVLRISNHTSNMMIPLTICNDIHYATTTLYASWPKLKPFEEWKSSIQGYSIGKVNIWEDESIGQFERKKKVHMSMLLILNGYRDRAVWVWGAQLFPPFSLMFMRLDKKWRWRNKGGHTRRIARILSTAARIKKLEDQLARTKHHLPTLELHWSWRWVFEHALYM